MKIINEQTQAWEEGSTNVFADLGHADADEKLVKVELAHKINQLIKLRDLKQKEAARLLDTDQAKISALSRGHLSIFSIERLVKYLNRLDQDVEIIIKSTPAPTHQGTVRVSYA